MFIPFKHINTFLVTPSPSASFLLSRHVSSTTFYNRAPYIHSGPRSELGQLNMQMASGSGYRMMRVHCMLDLVDISAAGAYNWSLLDDSMDALVDVGLTPFINLNGNPTGALHSLFQGHDFLFPAKLSHWRDLMEALGRHLVERYTAPAVRTWAFERRWVSNTGRGGLLKNAHSWLQAMHSITTAGAL